MKGIKRIKKILLSTILAVCSLYLAGCSGSEKKGTEEYFKARALEVEPAQYPEVTGKGEVQKEEQQKRMAMVKDKLYVETGEISKKPRWGFKDFRFKSSVKKGKPTKNLQTNFGKGYGGKYSIRKNRIEILIDKQWHVFAYNENDLDDVTMEVKSNTNHSLVINVNNQSDKEIECGSEYQIEYLDPKIETWSSLPYKHDDIGFEAVAYCLNKGDKEFNYDWDYLYGKLKPGKYRIVKDFFEYIEGQEIDNHTLTAEFEIK